MCRPPTRLQLALLIEIANSLSTDLDGKGVCYGIKIISQGITVDNCAVGNQMIVAGCSHTIVSQMFLTLFTLQPGVPVEASLDFYDANLRVFHKCKSCSFIQKLCINFLLCSGKNSRCYLANSRS